jgi:hypothetical protein
MHIKSRRGSGLPEGPARQRPPGGVSSAVAGSGFGLPRPKLFSNLEAIFMVISALVSCKDVVLAGSGLEGILSSRQGTYASTYVSNLAPAHSKKQLCRKSSLSTRVQQLPIDAESVKMPREPGISTLMQQQPIAAESDKLPGSTFRDNLHKLEDGQAW